jgi:uncharacterized protein with PIN domain
MLGKVAKWLRILGFDARFERLRSREQVDSLRGEGYLVVTRNRRWLGIQGVHFLTSNSPSEQLRELVAAVPVSLPATRPLRRCIVCNRPLHRISREEAFGSVPDYVYETSGVFFKCHECSRVYWCGSHPGRMRDRIRRELGWSIPLERTDTEEEI